MTLPTHLSPALPGEPLIEEWLKPLRATQLELVRRLGVELPLVSTVIRHRKCVTALTARRQPGLRKASPELWLNAQLALDLWRAHEELKGETFYPCKCA